MNSLIGYYGGKTKLMPYITPFPLDYYTYVEVFGGSGAILFAKVPSRVEIINDINSRLVNMWNAIKQDRRKFVDYCENEYGIDSREIFNYCKNNVAEDKIEDAARYYYINSHSFSHTCEAYHGISFNKKELWHGPYLKKLKRIEEIYERIKNVQVENQDFRKLIKRCDHEGVLLYLDPPYFKGGEIYIRMAGCDYKWGMKDFEDLRKILTNLEHAKFVLSIDRADFWLETMPKLYVQPVDRYNSVAKVKIGEEKSKDTEYVLRNFDNNCEKMKNIKITSDMEL